MLTKLTVKFILLAQAGTDLVLCVKNVLLFIYCYVWYNFFIMEEKIKEIVEIFKNEATKRLVGQENLVTDILMAFVAGGHVLLEGVPGLGKTLTVKTVAKMLGLDFKRIQFTPDLLPADITGTLIYEQNKGVFSVRKGPVFSNIILADEVNRAPAKVQSAMLEAMEERHVTIGEKTYELPSPFFVLATQNPIEQEGTYNLPEAELDRFLMKLIVDYPSVEDEMKIVKSCGNVSFEPVNQVISSNDLNFLISACDKVNLDDKILKYIVSIINVTRPVFEKNSQFGHSLKQNSAFSNNSSLGGKFSSSSSMFVSKSSDITRAIQFGASPRAGIAMAKCSKVKALFEGRDFVLPEDVKSVACNVLRHRIVLSYEAAADNVQPDEIILRILDLVPIP